jgi:cytochrome c-type biogenesis protein
MVKENLNVLLVFGAGLASVLSPCIFPLLPVVVTGSASDHRLRPVMIVAGLSLTFVVMGIVSSLFGSIIGPKMVYVEKAAAVVIVIFGVLLLLNINLFERYGYLFQISRESTGLAGGFILGATLGIIWIPCIGPLLSGVLFMVAVKKQVVNGMVLLFVYSLGFAVPLLCAGYAAQFFRKRFGSIGKYHVLVNVASGLILVAFGVIIFFKGVFDIFGF